MALPISSLKVQTKPLKCPPLTEIASVLQQGLSNLFEECAVTVVDCPDLRVEPFNLVSEGLCGKTAVIESGGVPYLLPTVVREKLYDMKELAVASGFTDFLLIGAGAGPWPYAKTNCELIANLAVKNNSVTNGSRIALVKNKMCDLQRLPDQETNHALLGNFFCSEGKPGKVLRVCCKKRTGNDDFVSCMRKSLAAHYKEEAVGMGGVFVFDNGKARQHVMPDFTKEIRSEESLNNWLNFFEMKGPLSAMGTFVSADPDLDLRVQHFHSFSKDEGGHFHNDVTPDTAEYLGYFNVGQNVVRVDRPLETHQMGRD